MVEQALWLCACDEVRVSVFLSFFSCFTFLHHNYAYLLVRVKPYSHCILLLASEKKKLKKGKGKEAYWDPIDTKAENGKSLLTVLYCRELGQWGEIAVNIAILFAQ